MIVISPALALTLSGQTTTNHPIVGWHNVVVADGVAADHEETEYPASNLANPSTAEAWRSGSTAEQYVTFTVTSEDEVDYVGIARHNFGTAQIAVSVEYPDPVNEGEWLELVPEFLAADDAPLLLRFTPTFLTQFRLRLQPDVVAPRAAVVYAGGLLVLQRRIYVGHTPITFGRETNLQQNWSEGGDYLGSVLLNERRVSGFSQANLTPAWLRTNLSPFLAVCKRRPWFFAWRPSDYPDEVGYVVAVNDPQPLNQRSNGMMRVDFQIAGMAL